MRACTSLFYFFCLCMYISVCPFCCVLVLYGHAFHCICCCVYVRVHASVCTSVLQVVFVPLHSARLCDCHFCHVCLDIFGSQLQFVGELPLRQLFPKAASISPCIVSLCASVRVKYSWIKPEIGIHIENITEMKMIGIVK